MKTGLFIAALAQLAVAQPHRYRHQHLHERQAVVTEVDIVTATAPDVVVFVDQHGNPVSTSYVNSHYHHHTTHHSSYHATTTPAAPVETSAVSVEPSAPVTSAAASSEPVYTRPSTTLVASTVSSAAAPTSTASSSGSSSGAGLGITYSPYNADGTCKSQSQVDGDFESLSNYDIVRTYGTDCNQLSTVGSAAIAKGMKIMAGVYNLAGIESEIALIVASANGNWKHIETVSIGNELINSGQASVSEVVSAISTARTLLSAAGFTGNVVTVDTWNAVLANPELCEASDFAAINAHAFFDSDATASTAGTIVRGYVNEVAVACSGKKVVVTESGWPSSGEANGLAVPSEANQQAAIASIKEAFSSNLILYTAFNDMWKSNFVGSFEAEQFWGMYGTSTQ